MYDEFYDEISSECGGAYSDAEIEYAAWNACSNFIDEFVGETDGCGGGPVLPIDVFFPPMEIPEGKKKSIAFLLLFLGGFYGLHNFYLGNVKRGVIELLLGIFLPMLFPYPVIRDLIRMLRAK